MTNEEYLILSEQYPSELQRSVNEHIADGWELAGSLSISVGGWYYQAMIRYVEVVEDDHD